VRSTAVHTEPSATCSPPRLALRLIASHHVLTSGRASHRRMDRPTWNAGLPRHSADALARSARRREVNPIGRLTVPPSSLSALRALRSERAAVCPASKVSPPSGPPPSARMENLRSFGSPLPATRNPSLSLDRATTSHAIALRATAGPRRRSIFNGLPPKRPLASRRDAFGVAPAGRLAYTRPPEKTHETEFTRQYGRRTYGGR